MKKYTLFALYLFTGDAFVRIINFCTTAYIARVLDTSGFGLITIGSSFLTYALLLSDCGLKTLGFIETARHQEKREFSLADIFSTKILLATISFIALYGASYILFKENRLHTICVLFLLNVLYDALFIDWYFKGIQRFKSVSIAFMVSSLIYFFAAVLFIKDPSDAAKAPLLFFVSNMVSVLILCMLFPWSTSGFRFTFSLHTSFAIFKNSLVIGLSTLLNQVTVYLPPIVLGMYLDVHNSGIFGAAFKIVLLALIADRVFSTIFLSTLPRIWNESRDNAVKYLQTIVHITIAAGFLVSLIISLGSETIISLIYGDTYRESSHILMIISWFIVLTMINTIFAYGLLAIGQKRLYLKATATGFVVNTILILILTASYGISGTCVSLLAGELIFMVLCYLEFKKFCNLRFYIPFLKSLFIGASLFFTGYMLPLHPLVKCIFAIPVFMVMTILFNVVTKNDLKLIRVKWNAQ